MKLQRYIFFLLLASVATAMMAVPARRLRRVFRLADGRRVEATLRGNQDYSFYLTDDGRALQKTERGYELGDVPLHDDGEADSAGETGATGDILSPGRRRRIGSAETAPLKPVGKKYVPLVLVEFQDLAFSVAGTTEEMITYYDMYCNGLNYTGHGSRGSIRDYFLEQSMGQFTPEFVIIGPVKLDHPYSYYGQDTYDDKGNIKTHDVKYSEFTNEAMAKAMDVYSQWSFFDNDGNGSVDMVYFLFAGMGQNNGGDDGTLWPKETTYAMMINGTRVATSAICCELQPRQWDDDGNVLSTRPDGIGVFIHELSHALGLPDFYDTRGTAFGMDIWSVMDYGEYCNNGYDPVNYTAYERDFMGWQELNTLSEPTTLHIPCFAEGGGGFKMVNRQNANEYYILENRQAMGWDTKLGRIATGLQVTHVDYSSSRWNNNTVNTDANHQRMTILAANDLYTGSYSSVSNEEYRAALEGQLFPGPLEMHELTDETTPASVVFSGGYMRQPLLDIQERDGMITLKYCPRGTLAMAANLVPVERSEHAFTAQWDAVQYAQCYNVELYQGEELIERHDSIEATELLFKELKQGDGYMFKVQPLADDYMNGEWNQSDVFSLDGSGIVSLPPSECVVRVYNMGGSFVTECFADEIHRLGLRSGVYVLRPMDGQKPSKIFIK